MSRPAPMYPGSKISIRLMGTPAVEWAGEVLSIPRRHVRGLLYHLAAQRLPSPRENLCLLFWPDISDANAHRNLTRALTHLRRSLPLPATLLTDKETVLLDERQFWCDVLEFRKLMQDGAGIENVQKAIALYRGSFLDGFYLPGCMEFERWMSQECTALEKIYLEALHRLVEAKTAEQDYANAILTAQRYLMIDELAEEMHRRLISLYALSGDRGRALRQFETCVSIFERELGARPLPETRAIYESVLAGKLPAPELPAGQATSPPQETRVLSRKIPLVGRSAAMGRLEVRFRQAEAGHSRVVLISGEPGIGKSRLMADFAERCRTNSHVLLGSGQLAETKVPYHPVVEALRSNLEDIPISLPPLWCAEVARILPELRSLYPEVPPPFSLKGEEARIRLFEALCRYIFALQEDARPVLLCFDDLHWFDRTSLSWLMHLCRQLSTQDRRVLVIGTYLSEDAGRIKELRDNIARLSLLDEIDLVGLDEPGILELCRHTLGEASNHETIALRLGIATGGNPFFVLETLRAIEERSGTGSDPDDLGEFPLPESVREVVNQRLGRLNPRCRQVLEAGAVLGHTFRFKSVQSTAGRSEMETSSALDVLVSCQLLVEEPDHYRFSHELVRIAALASTGLMRRTLLHARAGKALERYEPEGVAILAAHFDAGGDWSKALHYYTLSAQKAEVVYAWSEAESHLERCRQILTVLDQQRSNPENLAKEFQIVARLTQLRHQQGKLEQRDADLLHMHELVNASHNQHFELQTLLLEVQTMNSDARYQDAITRAEEGLALADCLQDLNSHSRMLSQIGLSYHMLGMPVKAILALQAASSEIDGSEDTALRIPVLGIMGQVYPVLGDYRHALDCVQEAYALHREMGDPYGAARYVDIGFLYANLGRFQEARQFLEECLAIARKAGVPGFEAHALLALGGTCLLEGNPVSAIENHLAALEILEGLRRVNLAASASAGIGFAYYHLGDLHQGRSWLERGLGSARSIGHRARIAQVLFQLALLEISAEQLPAAESKVSEGLAIAREIRAVENISVGLSITAHIERRLGVPDKARGYAQEALHYAQQHDLMAVEVLSRVEAALALTDLGRLPSACEHTSKAISLLPRAHQLWIGAEQVHRAHARVLKGMGEMQAAEEHDCIALAILHEKGNRIPDLAQRTSFLAKSGIVY